MITYDKMTVTGAFGIRRLTEFEARIMPGVHATAVVIGESDDITDLQKWQKSRVEQEVTIGLEDKGILFCGLVYSAIWKREASALYRVELLIISGSISLDREKKFVSFQDKTKSYVEIVEHTISSIPGACCICTTDTNQKPLRPIIQYAETDWEFAKRLASMIGTVIYPEVCRHGAYMWMGIPECGKEIAEFETKNYVHGISSAFYELGGTASGYSRRDFEYYRVECGDSFNVGVDAEYAGIKWKILEKHLRLERGEVHFTYLLGRTSLVAVKKTYNPLLVGRSIFGKVLRAEGESVKLHLEIDQTQDMETAYSYKWVPDTGSVMYCMPENGMTVSLYFPDEDERNAVAVNCIRHNGSTCSDMVDPAKRALTTTEGKRFCLNPSDTGVEIEKSGHKISLEDEKGIIMKSGKALNISAVQGIELAARAVFIETAGALNLLRDPDR